MKDAASRIVSLSRSVGAVVAAVGALGIGTVFGLPLGLLFAAGAVLVLVISLLWSSVQSVSGETPLSLDEAIGLGAPSAEEERKRSILRAINDLRYERSVGKISEEDYTELTERYRREAKALLKALDRDYLPGRQRAEKLLERRLKKEGHAANRTPAEVEDGAPTKEVSASDEPSADASEAATESSPVPTTDLACLGCGTENDADAHFCKRCGATLAAVEPAS